MKYVLSIKHGIADTTASPMSSLFFCLLCFIFVFVPVFFLHDIYWFRETAFVSVILKLYILVILLMCG